MLVAGLAIDRLTKKAEQVNQVGPLGYVNGPTFWLSFFLPNSHLVAGADKAGSHPPGNGHLVLLRPPYGRPFNFCTKLLTKAIG